ncbi:hypothetical protein [Ralstonia phage RP13]|nr:hypothetical protein [Ralstonia phage RP13]
MSVDAIIAREIRGLTNEQAEAKLRKMAAAWSEISTHLHVYETLLTEARDDCNNRHDRDKMAYYDHELKALREATEVSK